MNHALHRQRGTTVAMTALRLRTKDDQSVEVKGSSTIGTSPGALVRVWLVDDDAALSERLHAAFAAGQSRLRLTGSFASGREVLQAIQRGETADVILVDLELPEVRGDILIMELRRQRVRVPLLAYTGRSDDAAIFSTLRAGANGYLTKDVSMAELESAVHAALNGAAPFSTEVGRRVVSYFWRESSNPSPCDLADLTTKERQILQVLATGASYREVGVLLHIAEGTVQSHVKRIYGKLGVRSKAEAARFAYQGSESGGHSHGHGNDPNK